MAISLSDVSFWQLNDRELDQLLSAIIVEQKRRGKQLAAVSRKEADDAVAAVPLTQGKLNAIRAAFKAGVMPSRIARHFGISRSDVTPITLRASSGAPPSPLLLHDADSDAFLGFP